MQHVATATSYRDLLTQLGQLATSESLTSVDSVAGGGTGYTVGDILTLAGGTKTHAATIEVLTAPGGVIATVRRRNGGAYTVAPTDPVSVTGGTGSGATFNCTFGATGWAQKRHLVQIGLTAASIVGGGTGYSTNDVLTVAGGTFTTAATIKVVTQLAGVITSILVLTPGEYTVAPSNPVSVTGGTGSGATFTASFNGTVGADELILQGIGFGSDEIYVGARTYYLSGPDVANWELAGMTGYTPANTFSNQPNLSPGRYEELGTVGGAYVPLANSSLTYWAYITGWSIRLVVRVAGNYSTVHLGFPNPFGTSNEFPYPLYICGSTSKYDQRFNSSLASYSSFVDPVASLTGVRGPGLFRNAAGAWIDVGNSTITASNTRTPLFSCVVYPAGAPGGLTPLDPSFITAADKISNKGPVGWLDIIPASASAGQPGTQLCRLKPTPMTGGAISMLVPATLIVASATLGAGVLGEIHQCYWISAEQSILPEDTFTYLGDTYRIFKSGGRQEIFTYFAVKED